MKKIIILALGCFIFTSLSLVLSLVIGGYVENGLIIIGLGFALVPFIIFALFGFLSGKSGFESNKSGTLSAALMALFSYLPLIIVYIFVSKSTRLDQILSDFDSTGSSTIQVSQSIDLGTIIQSFIPFIVIATILGKIGEVREKKKRRNKGS